MARNNLLGAWGEAMAAEYLRKKRYEPVAAGYRSRFGEIDLIVRNRTFLVFVEVKLRKDAKFARAFEYVDRPKQDRIRMTASMYLSQNPTKLQPRFDVIEIYAPDGMDTRHPQIYHMEDAFQ
jgi:putative endonuclease